MMFYKVEDIKYTTYNLKSIEIVNSDINNEEKKRISTYITLLTLLSSMLLYSPTLAAQKKKNNHRGRKRYPSIRELLSV